MIPEGSLATLMWSRALCRMKGSSIRCIWRGADRNSHQLDSSLLPIQSPMQRKVCWCMYQRMISIGYLIAIEHLVVFRVCKSMCVSTVIHSFVVLISQDSKARSRRFKTCINEFYSIWPRIGVNVAERWGRIHTPAGGFEHT